MYAVIKTGGKQYRVSPGDLLVVEKLEGEPGAAVAFGDVLMLGDGEAVRAIAAPVAIASTRACCAWSASPPTGPRPSGTAWWT
jgi:large subunit ribosomal protein L21